MMNKTIVPTLLLLALAGCATPTPRPPDAGIQSPNAWLHAPPQTAETAIDRVWWRSFGSEELDRLIADAQQQSLDIAAATARVQQAEALSRIAGAPLLPNIDAALGRSREGRLGGNADVAGKAYTATIAASYEVDFWGKNRAVRDTAVFSLQASAFDRDTVRLTVTAGAAATWLQIGGLNERVTIAQSNLANAQGVLQLIVSRQRAGAATQLDLAQQRGLVAAAQRAVAALMQQRDDARTALAVLLGRTQQDANDNTANSHAIAGIHIPAIAPGLPATLTTRRPDIARAESQLAAADANVVAARAAMLPSVNLSGTAGAGSNHLRTLFDNPIYSLAAGLTAPIFNGGRLAAERDLAIAQKEELLIGYRAAIVAAFGDVEIALNAIAGIDAQRDAQQEELRQAQQAYALAESRYRAGADTMLTLLDAQRTLYGAEDLASQLKLARLQAAVSLYKVLGGGWQAAS